MIAAVLICAILIMSDGDSGRCSTADGGSHRVRLQGIDAVEVRPFSAPSSRPAKPGRKS
jgi:endonuclease YncB( thermonuclease family)